MYQLIKHAIIWLCIGWVTNLCQKWVFCCMIKVLCNYKLACISFYVNHCPQVLVISVFFNFVLFFRRCFRTLILKTNNCDYSWVAPYRLKNQIGIAPKCFLWNVVCMVHRPNRVSADLFDRIMRASALKKIASYSVDPVDEMGLKNSWRNLETP